MSMPTILKALFAGALAGCVGDAASQNQQATRPEPSNESATPLTAAKLLIEHNATAADTGFQGFVDGEPWKHLDLLDGDGTPALRIEASGRLRPLGLTELFFETDEPANADVPIEELLATLPAGAYEYRAKSVEGPAQTGVAHLSHEIPSPVIVIEPCDESVVDAATDLVFAWRPVATGVFGEPIEISHYQLIVERAEQVPHPGFGAETLSMHVRATTTLLRVPREFLEPGLEYSWEILAIAANGNQTIRSGQFVTR